jgi:hypothetical protein
MAKSRARRRLHASRSRRTNSVRRLRRVAVYVQIASGTIAALAALIQAIKH